jgi:hypothetical protein
VFGSWIANSYSTEPMFLDSHLLEIFTDPPPSGLSVWLPALGVGMVGCFALALRRRDPVALASGAAWLLHLYVISRWHAWSTLVERCPFDLIFPICLGFAYFLATAGRKAGVAVLTLLIAWGVPLVASPPASGFPFGWPQGFTTLTGVSKVTRLWRSLHGTPSLPTSDPEKTNIH